jgi:hypothetical protein
MRQDWGVSDKINAEKDSHCVSLSLVWTTAVQCRWACSAEEGAKGSYGCVSRCVIVVDIWRVVTDLVSREGEAGQWLLLSRIIMKYGLSQLSTSKNIHQQKA